MIGNKKLEMKQKQFCKRICILKFIILLFAALISLFHVFASMNRGKADAKESVRMIEEKAGKKENEEQTNITEERLWENQGFVYRIKINHLCLWGLEDDKIWYEICVQNLGEATLKEIKLSYEFSDTSLKGTWQTYRTEYIQGNMLIIPQIESLKSHRAYLSVYAAKEPGMINREEGKEDEDLICTISGTVKSNNGENTIVKTSVALELPHIENRRKGVIY